MGTIVFELNTGMLQQDWEPFRIPVELSALEGWTGQNRMLVLTP
ncbi:MAG: hypothetical protein QME79_07935 [Bacillota bacterium]|nr:hypothetical protein [Bacillota bacterium]